MTQTKTRQWRLARRPVGMAQEADFTLAEADLTAPREGEALVRTIYLSVDPYMRGRISEGPSYASPVPIGGVMVGGTVGQVLASRDPDIKDGDLVVGYWGWQDHAVVKARGLTKLDPKDAPISTAVGVLGMPGRTAYFGLLDVGLPRPGDTVFVSGAAGAVGATVGQIARITGCTAVGSAGGGAKIAYLKEIGFDGTLDYKAENDLRAALDRACPKGIDVYFDNVGGALTDAVLERINLGARVVICGQIAGYNERGKEQGPRNLWQLIVKRARIQGMLVSDFDHRADEANTRLRQWIREGRIKYRETVVDGLENAPKAFIGLFTGANIGKQLVRVGPDPTR
ncbi:MAG: NADP-dependent oxidoreductase [Alphaproteobacteria bacterium]|nr:NADP-dependent oxidoreductase [Alphaproteobacteria bacterium]